MSRILTGKHIFPDDCWILFQKKLAKSGSWVTVYTKDGKEIKGYLKYAGRIEADKELIISNPTLIARDKTLKPTIELNLGLEMFFTEDDIARIAFFEHL